MVETQNSSQEQFQDLQRILTRDGPFADKEIFEPDPELLDTLQNDAKVLVIGAGGLGCEILKDLALSGLRNITVIDLDKIDLTNLNRQFLFREKDIGEYKAKVAAEFVMKRCPGTQIEYHTDPIQNFDMSFYEQFQVIIAGLDNVEARRWINGMVHRMVTFDKETDEPDVNCILIDGGTEGFMGQARVIEPYKAGCYECTLASLPQEETYPLCTIKETPRVPQHCIQYAYMVQWPDTFKRPVDKDSPEDMQWICDKAIERANQYGIEGVDYKLTMGVVKNIIPAIASTNALVSAACVNECVKVLTGCNPVMDNYMMFLGQTRTTSDVHRYDKNPDCFICSRVIKEYNLPATKVLQEFLDEICKELGLKNPQITNVANGKMVVGTGIFASKSTGHKEMTLAQLQEAEVLMSGDQMTECELTDPNCPSVMQLRIKVVYQ